MQETMALSSGKLLDFMGSYTFTDIKKNFFFETGSLA